MELEMLKKKHLMFFSGSSNLPLAHEVAASLGVELGNSNLKRFPSSELYCRYQESVRGADVFILQTHCSTPASLTGPSMSINDSLMELVLLVDAAKRAGADTVTVVCPFMAYSRQDRRPGGREPISAKVVYSLLEAAGVDRVMILDNHSGQAQGFINREVAHLTAMPVLLKYLKNNLADDLVIVSPDAGRVKVSERYANALATADGPAEMAIIRKTRENGEVMARDVVGNVGGKVCVVIDDMIDTAGTICEAAKILRKHGASNVIAMATHGIFSGPALERLEAAPIDKLVVTNTFPVPVRLAKLEVLSVGGIIAESIKAIFTDGSMSAVFHQQNQV